MWFFVVGLLFFAEGADARPIVATAQEDMTAVELIEYWGYPAEEYQTITDDGFFLTLHRIPHGKDGPSSNRPVIFLQHGLEDSSVSWVLNFPNKSAGFIFADAGYDVWMGNMRGNVYSKDHLTYTPKMHEFWNFTFDEMVQYDLKALIGFTLKTTKQPDLYYVGHSQGTLTMFSKLSRDKEFGKKIKKFFALAPVGTVKHISGLLRIVSNEYLDFLSWYYYFYGDSEFVPSDWILSKVGEYLCKGVGGRFCDYFFMLIMGVDSNQLNPSRTSIYMGHTPAGTSTKNFVHWSQMVGSGLLCEYDYGKPKDNLLHYGQATAPIYDLTKIDPSTQIYLYWSSSDWLADEKDITEFLLKKLPATTITQNNKLDGFNHIDFLWGDKAADQVYKPILDTIAKNS